MFLDDNLLASDGNRFHNATEVLFEEKPHLNPKMKTSLIFSMCF